MCRSSYHSVTTLHSMGLQGWCGVCDQAIFKFLLSQRPCGVCDRAIFKFLLSQRPSCVDLKGKTVGQLPIIGVEGIGKEIPVPNLDLVLRHPLARLSLLVVGGCGDTKKLFADLDIAGLLPKALVKVHCVAVVQSERADRLFETRHGSLRQTRAAQ